MYKTVTHTNSTIQFDEALRQAAARAKALYAGETPRIERGLILALNGKVHFKLDHSAEVESATDPEVRYIVANGLCDCPDHLKAPEGRCKHKWARSLVCKALTIQQETPAGRFYAIYTAPDETEHHGIATQTTYGWLFIDDTGMDPFYASTESLTILGNVALADAQLIMDMAATK